MIWAPEGKELAVFLDRGGASIGERDHLAVAVVDDLPAAARLVLADGPI